MFVIGLALFQISLTTSIPTTCFGILKAMFKRYDPHNQLNYFLIYLGSISKGFSGIYAGKSRECSTSCRTAAR